MGGGGGSLLPPDPPDAGPPAPRGRTSIACEFCGCTLTPNGEYLQLSDQAKEFRGQGERIDALKAVIAEKQTALDDATRLLDEARSEISRLTAAPTKRPIW